MADDEKTPETPAADDDAQAPIGDANRAKPTATVTVSPSGTTAAVPTTQPQGVTGEVYTKAEMERIVQDRIKRDQEKRAKEEEKVRKDAIAAALKEQGDFAKLADAKQAEADDANRKVAELEPVLATTTDERDRYRKALEKNLTAQRKGLPKHILALLDKNDVADQLEWLAENADAVRAPEPPPRPNGSTPARGAATAGGGETTPQLPRPREPLARV